MLLQLVFEYLERALQLPIEHERWISMLKVLGCVPMDDECFGDVSRGLMLTIGKGKSLAVIKTDDGGSKALRRVELFEHGDVALTGRVDERHVVLRVEDARGEVGRDTQRGGSGGGGRVIGGRSA